jgi:hypothetical protein
VAIPTALAALEQHLAFLALLQLPEEPQITQVEAAVAGQDRLMELGALAALAVLAVAVAVALVLMVLGAVVAVARIIRAAIQAVNTLVAEVAGHREPGLTGLMPLEQKGLVEPVVGLLAEERSILQETALTAFLLHQPTLTAKVSPVTG